MLEDFREIYKEFCEKNLVIFKFLYKMLFMCEDNGKSFQIGKCLKYVIYIGLDYCYFQLNLNVIRNYNNFEKFRFSNKKVE